MSLLLDMPVGHAVCANRSSFGDGHQLLRQQLQERPGDGVAEIDVILWRTVGATQNYSKKVMPNALGFGGGGNGSAKVLHPKSSPKKCAESPTTYPASSAAKLTMGKANGKNNQTKCAFHGWIVRPPTWE